MLPNITQKLSGLLVACKKLFSAAFYKEAVEFIRSFVVVWFWQTLTFTGLLMIYLANGLINKVFSSRLVPARVGAPVLKSVAVVYKKIVLLSTKQERTINRVSLIDLAVKNMLFKRSRAMITVGGMAIGIGAIVFLVSIGFGLQELVISRVARLDELQQADVSTQPGSKETITDETIAKFADFEHIEETLPMIAIVARVEFQNSVSDMAVYGVTSNFLKRSAVQPVRGDLFDSNELAVTTIAPRVAGVTDEYYEGEYALTPDVELPVEFSIHPEEMLKVRANPTSKATLIGFTRRGYGIQQGARVWGEMYPEASEMKLQYENVNYAPWIKADFPIWLAQSCEGVAPECIDGKFALAKTDTGEQLIATGFTALRNLSLHTVLAPSDPVGQVLGVTTEDDTNVLLALAEETVESEDESVEEGDVVTAGVAIASADSTSQGDWIEIASESAATKAEEIVKVSLGSGAKRQAVVNRAMLQILNMPEEEAVGKAFSASFVVVGDLLNKPGEKVESIPEEYTIVGVVPDEKSPFFYVPFVDLRLLGITQFSQLKIVADSSDNLVEARKQVEALGFSTRSVADTVNQIDKLFGTARIILAILGFVALSIAALGMFNTLTVSLLERTREVGLMKAMGMRSNEVRELFLTESLVMGFFGGILGILLGSLSSELLGLALSAVSISKGIGYIDVSYLPATFVTFIFVLSLVVGVFTGIYPARRATKISALDALRYE